MGSLAYGSRLNNRALGSGVCIYTYRGGTSSVSELWVLSLSSAGTGGVLGLDGTGSGGGAHVPLRLQRVCGSFAVPFWQGRQLSVWFSRIIAGCLSITAITLLSLRNTTPRFFSSRSSARGSFIRRWVSSIAARENPSVGILAILKARHLLDDSNCTRPPCYAIVADMLKTYKKLVAASKVRFGCYLNHTELCSLLLGFWSLFCPVQGTFISKFVCEIPRTHNIVMLNRVDCAGRCLGRPCKFPVTGSNELVT